MDAIGWHFYVSNDHPRILTAIEEAKVLLARNPSNPNHRRIVIDSATDVAIKGILIDAGWLPPKLSTQAHFEIRWALHAAPMFEKVRAIILLGVE